MLIAVYTGKSRDRAKRSGEMHFVIAPRVGEHVEVDGLMLVVQNVWHQPDAHFAGPKLGILVSDHVQGDSEREDAGPRESACAFG